MDIEAAPKLTKAEDLYRACIEAETRNVESHIIRQLYARYYAAIEKEQNVNLLKQREESKHAN